MTQTETETDNNDSNNAADGTSDTGDGINSLRTKYQCPHIRIANKLNIRPSLHSGNTACGFEDI